jgi:hypothetical protein
MHQTYELYLRDVVDRTRFEPLTCRTAGQVMEKIRERLASDASIASVEVRLAGQHLFTLDR